jgi:hypothetical protein
MNHIEDLCEEVKSIITENSFSASSLAIETNHMIGKAIAEHEAYKKHAHGAGTLVRQVAEYVGKSEQHLYLCVKFYMKYPEVSSAFETLATDSKQLSWRHVARALSQDDPEAQCKHENTYKVTYTCCRKCDYKIKT